MVENVKKLERKRHLLYFALFLSTFATYLLIPILPIYLVEPLMKGGLAWSKGEAFSLFGTFLACVYVSPFLGGLLADFLLGKTLTLVFGYFLCFLGSCSLFFFDSKDLFVIGLLEIAVGAGFLRVSLTSVLSSETRGENREKDFDGLYISLSLGFIFATFLSQVFFEWMSMSHVFAISFVAFLLSGAFGFFTMQGKMQETEKVEKEESQRSSLGPLFFLLFLGAVFFVFMSQSMAASAIFVQQELPRNVFGFTVPTLWFQAFGSLVMVFSLAFRRKLWGRIDSLQVMSGPLKLGVAFLFLTLSFSSLYFLTVLPKESIWQVLQIVVIMISFVCFSFADSHVRPVLLSESSRSVSMKYQTLATGCVYCAIGLGGKLGGEFAGCVEYLGFPSFFLVAAFSSVFFAVVSYVFWRRLQSSLQAA
jgi:proton-dependent oligopeptide transporter, POT family